jgi:hypothetical protein
VVLCFAFKSNNHIGFRVGKRKRVAERSGIHIRDMQLLNIRDKEGSPIEFLSLNSSADMPHRISYRKFSPLRAAQRRGKGDK